MTKTAQPVTATMIVPKAKRVKREISSNNIEANQIISKKVNGHDLSLVLESSLWGLPKAKKEKKDYVTVKKEKELQQILRTEELGVEEYGLLMKHIALGKARPRNSASISAKEGLLEYLNKVQMDPKTKKLALALVQSWKEFNPMPHPKPQIIKID